MKTGGMSPVERGLRSLWGSAAVLVLPAEPGLRLAYGQDPQQFGDLYLPAGRGPHPVVAVIHGGFWRERYNLDHISRLCAALVDLDVAVWSLEYRRVGCPGGGWPGTFLDVAAGIAFLQQITGTYSLDLERLILLGHSAGGQLALWAAAAGRFPPGHELHVPSWIAPRGVIALAGVCDLRRAWELNLSDGAAAELLGGSPGEVPERYAAASPQDLLPLGVPQTLLHGTEDEDVPLEFSERYVRAARSRGEQAAFVPLYGMGHFEAIDPRSLAWEPLSQVLLEMIEPGTNWPAKDTTAAEDFG